jgi:hypothetical protein
VAEAKPRVREDLDVVDVDGEAVVYDPVGRDVHYMNHSAALVFGLCDGASTAREISSAIAEVYEMPVDDVYRQVRELLKGLRSKELLERPGEQPAWQPPGWDADERGLVRLAVPESG